MYPKSDKSIPIEMSQFSLFNDFLQSCIHNTFMSNNNQIIPWIASKFSSLRMVVLVGSSGEMPWPLVPLKLAAAIARAENNSTSTCYLLQVIKKA